jgi:hypothetical protein
MSDSQSYWYNLTSQSVERAEARPSEDTIGPFATAAEAEESPAVLLEHARAWLDSEESEPFRALLEGEDGAEFA